MINKLFDGTIIRPIFLFVKFFVLGMQIYFLVNQLKYRNKDEIKSEGYMYKVLLLAIIGVIL